MSLAKVLSILFIFSKNQILVLSIFTVVSFISFVIFVIFFLLLTLGFFLLFFPNCFRCKVRLSIFLKYKFIYFNWRLITLQYCIGFVIHQHESTTGIHLFPIPNPPPSWIFNIINLSVPFFMIVGFCVLLKNLSCSKRHNSFC